MPRRKLHINPRARRDLKSLPAPMRKAILAALESFAAETLPNADIKKLQDRNPPEYRLRVGDYRVFFEADAESITVLRVADRKEAYR